MRTINRITNKTKTANMGGVSRLALAMASAMTIWHGAAVADNAAPAPSNAEASAPAAVQPFADSKQVVAIAPNPANAERTIYWWSDGGYSDWHNTQQKFVVHAISQGAYFNERGWPAGKQAAAIGPHPYDSNLTVYWWSDGDHSEWDKTQRKFVSHDPNPGVWFDSSGLLRGKRVVAIGPSPLNPEQVLYWWNDGGYASWDNKLQSFTSYHSDQGLFFTLRGWPIGKQVVAIAADPANADRIIYWWSDGSRSDWSTSQDQFVAHEPNQGSWFDDRGWPITVFDPAQYEVLDVRVNPDSAGGVIYANGRMQYKVVVRAQIVDKVTNKGVRLSDRGTSVNEEGQLRDLVTLYLGDDEVDTPGANLAIDGVGDYASSTWKASRTDAGYDKSLNVFAHYSEQIDGSIVEHDQDDDAAYPASEGWNSYVYWVSTTEQTGPDPMSICARVGGYNSDDDDDDDDGYLDSCEDDWDNSAQVKSLPPKRYVTSDYDIATSKINVNDESYHNYALTTVALKNERIKSASISSPPSGGRSDCVGRYSEYFPYANEWNYNTSLHMIPFGDKSYRVNVLGVYSGTDHRSEDVKELTNLQSDRINLVQARALLVQYERGTWTNCTSYAPYADIDVVGSIQFIDGYGNDGSLNFRRVDWEYLVQ